jgi:hypothetical protein
MRKAEILSEEDAFKKTYEIKEHMKHYGRIYTPHSLVGKTVRLVEVTVQVQITDK